MGTSREWIHVDCMDRDARSVHCMASVYLLMNLGRYSLIEFLTVLITYI